MAVGLNPYLNFDGKTREAMTFYQSVFGGKLLMNTFEDFHVPGDPGEEQKIMHAMLETPNGMVLMAADFPNRMSYQAGNNFRLSLSGDDETQLRAWFERLSAGGMVAEPLRQALWGDIFGMVIDQYGVSWMVNISAPKG